VRIDLDGTVEDLRVAYTIPAPMWRVSYRVIALDDVVTLMAWAIIHNPADEDLSDVMLTLTTGQPVSFVTELYEPRRVARARLEEADRAVAAPRKLGRALRKASTDGMPPPQMAAPAPMQLNEYSAPAPRGGAAMGALSETTIAVDDGFAAQVESGDRAEHFEYRVGRPVTLRRGGSAMVPILSAKVKTARERIWRDGQGPAPDIVLRFDNTTDAVLEEGPSVIYDEGSYGGEAMVPYSARGSEVRLAFARDLAVRCSRTVENSVRLDAIRIQGLVAWERHERRDEHTLMVENDHDEPIVVIFEVPKRVGHDVVEGLRPVEETAGYFRFAVESAPRATTKATFVERWVYDYRLDLERLDAHRLKSWFSADKLDPATGGALRGVMETWQEAADLERASKDHANEMDALAAQAHSFKEQLGVLRADGEEGALRMRWVHELSAIVERQKHLYEEQQRLHAKAVELRARAREVLSTIDVGGGTP
jgi:hypothetical protein